MFIDDLPMWGFVGEVVHEEFLLGKSIQGARVYLYPHLHFTIGFNGNQIVTANVTTDVTRRVDVTDTSVGQEIVFSYSVEWVHTPDVKYADRLKRYADSTFLPSTFEIHWLSIINSFVLVILLTAFLSEYFLCLFYFLLILLNILSIVATFYLTYFYLVIKCYNE